MKRRRVAAASLLALAVVGGIAWLALRPAPQVQARAPVLASDGAPVTEESDPMAAPTGDRTGATQAAQRIDATAIRATAGALTAALPPLEAPLAGIIDDLDRRARTGEARAACRLAAELSRCATLPRRREMAAVFDPAATGPTNGPAGGNRDWMIDMAARMENALERDEAHCAGVRRERLREAPAWLHRAARAGHAPSMAAFAAGIWLEDTASVHHPALVEAYRTEAAAMAEAALAAGDRGMLLALGTALTGSAMRLRLAEVVEPDPARGHALLRLAVENLPTPMPGMSPSAATPPRAAWRSEGAESAFATRRLARVEAGLTPAQRNASEAIAAEWRARLESVQPTAPAATRVDPGQYLAAADCTR